MMNHQFTTKIFSAVLAMICLGGISCSVEYPNGKMACNPLMGNSDCPAHWSCINGFCSDQEPMVEGIGSDAASDAYTSGSFGSDANSISTTEPACVAVTKCEPDQCGKINACVGPLDCGACPNSFICQNNECGTTTECIGCTIDGMCYDPGAIKPGSGGCELCKPALSKTSWSPTDGVACDDGKFCTITDTCKGSQCVGTKRTCEDNSDLTKDSCSEQEKACKNDCTCKKGQVCNFDSNKCEGDCKSTECNIEGVCYADKKVNPTNECQVCDASLSKLKWTPRTAQSCGKAPEDVCDGQPTCNSSGKCENILAKEGTDCGNTKDDDCSERDTCDGKGNCLDNHKKPEVKCGDNTPGECENQRFCDGKGACAPQTYEDKGTPCGAKIAGNICQENQCDSSHRCTPTAVNNSKWCKAGDSTCVKEYQCSEGICNKAINADTTVCRKEDKNACVKAAMCKELKCPDIDYYDGTACALNPTKPCYEGKCSKAEKSCVPVQVDDYTTCDSAKGSCCKGTCTPNPNQDGKKACEP